MNPNDAVSTDDPTTSFLSIPVAERAPIVSTLPSSAPPTVQLRFRRRANHQAKPSQGEHMHIQQNERGSSHPCLLRAVNFVKTEIEKFANYVQTTWLPQQSKSLSPEEKRQMKIFVGNRKTLELLSRIENLAPPLYLLTRDEKKVVSFLRLVCVLPYFH